MIESIFMSQRIPLPIRDGLNPSKVVIPEEAEGITACAMLEHLIRTQRFRNPADNEQALYERFHSGQVRTHEGEILKPDSILHAGDIIWFYRMPAQEPPVPYEIKIIYEDEDLLVVDKPPFLATFPRASHITETVLVRLRRATKNNDLVPAHRLDRLTSGVLVLIKKPHLRGIYQELFSRREVHKEYEAIAAIPRAVTELEHKGQLWAHRLEKIHGEMRTKILDGEANSFTEVIDVTPISYENAPHSLQKQIDAGRINLQESPLARYRLHPITGKTHQLRVHMMLAGVPILGDPLYPTILPRDEENFEQPMYLHSCLLSFTDPRTGQVREFQSQSY